MVLGKLLAPNKPDPGETLALRGGFESVRGARMKFDVRYYLVAILFILLTSRSVSFPVGAGGQRHRPGGIPVDDAFLAILTVGFVYEWMKGALEWE